MPLPLSPLKEILMEFAALPELGPARWRRLSDQSRGQLARLWLYTVSVSGTRAGVEKPERCEVGVSSLDEEEYIRFRSVGVPSRNR